MITYERCQTCNELVDADTIQATESGQEVCEECYILFYCTWCGSTKRCACKSDRDWEEEARERYG